MKKNGWCLWAVLAFVFSQAGAVASEPCSQLAARTSLGVGNVAKGAPTLTALEEPVIGSSFLRVAIAGGKPGVEALLLIGTDFEPESLPEFEGTLYPAGELRSLPVVLDGAGAAQLDVSGIGFVGPELCGQRRVLQVGVPDERAPGGYALSAALEVRFGREPEALFFPGGDRVPESSASPPLLVDLNQDGLLDAVDADTTEAALRVRLGGAEADFDSPREIPLEFAPTRIYSSDVDLDGVPDVLVVHPLFGAGRVSVLLGRGDGRFDLAALLVAGPSSSSVAIGDLNGDELPDLAVGNFFGSSLSIFLGLGEGQFAQPESVPAELSVRDVRLVDIDGDASLDLVALRSAGELVPGALLVYRGLGTGGFAPATFTSTAPGLFRLASADLDGDSLPDLVAYGGTGEVAQVFRGDPSGVPIFTGSVPTDSFASLTIHDIDADEILDLVVGSGASDDYRVWRGLGDGTFGNGEVLLSGLDGRAQLQFVELNGDGLMDIAVGSLLVFLQREDASFGRPELEVGPLAADVLAVDLDKRSLRPEIASISAAAQAVAVFTPEAESSYAPAIFTEAGVEPARMASGDLDLDGNLDLVVQNAVGPSAIDVFLGDGMGGLAPRFVQDGGTFPSDLLLEDMDADGLLDLVSLNPIPARVRISRGLGDGSFGLPSPSFCGNSPVSMGTGDFNGDGLPDVVVANAVVFGPGAGVSLLLGSASGGLGAPISVGGFFPSSLIVRDHDDDGDLDVIVNVINPNPGLWLLRGDGAGGLVPEPSYVEGIGEVFGFAHLNGDDAIDLYDLAPAAGGVVVRAGERGGAFGPPQFFPAGIGNGGAVVARDLDADGHTDLAVSAPLSGKVFVLLNSEGD